MADYTEEQRVKQVYPDAKCYYSPMIASWVVGFDVQDSQVMGHEERLGYGETEAEAWADASRRLGNEFVDEVGPLAERKEG